GPVSPPQPVRRIAAEPDAAAGPSTPGDVAVPLPPLLCETNTRVRRRASPCPRPLPGAMLNPPIQTDRPEPGRTATRVPLVVDSGEASD
ncbi:MAG: hypothetical protein ACRD5D_07460, partial [Candidatus Polarisedimenticolia bacterium]